MSSRQDELLDLLDLAFRPLFVALGAADLLYALVSHRIGNIVGVASFLVVVAFVSGVFLLPAEQPGVTSQSDDDEQCCLDQTAGRSRPADPCLARSGGVVVERLSITAYAGCRSCPYGRTSYLPI